MAIGSATRLVSVGQKQAMQPGVVGIWIGMKSGVLDVSFHGPKP